MAEFDRIISAFYDLNAALCKMNSIYHKARLLQKAINVFHDVNLFMVTSEKG